MIARKQFSFFQRALNICVMLAMLLSIFGITQPAGAVLAASEKPVTADARSAAVPSAGPAAAPAFTTAPETVVNTGGVSDYFRTGTVVYWHASGSCYTPPGAPPADLGQPVNGITSIGDTLETVARISLTGASQKRTLYSKDLRATNDCNPYVFSRVVADSDFIYWVDSTGLVKLSKNANLGDTPQLVSASYNDKLPYEIAIGGNFIYLSRAGVPCGPGICVIVNPLMVKVDKTTGAATGIDCTFLSGCPYGHNMKVDPNGRYLYYLNSSNSLYRKNLSGGPAAELIATNVTAYYPEGRFLVGCFLTVCVYSDKLFYAQGDHIINRDFEANTTTTVYTSNSPTTASINDLISDQNALFFFEVRQDVCTQCGFFTYTGWMFRSGRTNAATLANIYQSTPSIFTHQDESVGMDTDNVKLYWVEGMNILRLSNQATALPKSPMHMTGIEVTQGLQTLSNSVPLIMGKRTFVRVYVKSDDPNRDVPGVTARLQATWSGLVTSTGWTDWVEPSNVASITVKRSPKRIHLNDGFLFELPWDWVNHLNLQIRAELNANHNPEESDGYGNNVVTVGPFIMNASPRLEVRLFDYSYSMGGKVFSPDPTEDQGNIDWITNAYPVNSSSYGFLGTTPGLVWENFPVRDDALADMVRYPTVPCEDKDTTQYPNDNLADCENLRASGYVNSQISGLRDGLENAFHDTDSTSYYGLIPEGKEMRGYPATEQSYFPRGLDTDKNASGPAGASRLGWYAGHEIGHSVGMGHPGTAGNTNECGIKGSDSLPTYAHAKIGANSDATSVMGFLDAPTTDYPRYNDKNLFLPSQTYDMMAYCLPQWISDQNYLRVFGNLTGYIPLSVQATTNTRINGDWLAVYGSIYDSQNTATMDYLEHKTGSVLVPAIVPGPYAIRLLDGNGAALANYAFTPSSADDAPLQMYGQVVAFVQGTRKVQIVRLSDQKVLGEHAISGSKPSISSVALVNPPNPVTGTVTLSWTASHPENLPLTFNVLYSRDNGVSFQPYLLHVKGTFQAVDTSKLGGSTTGKFRVVASDGANTASADSASFVMGNKPPVAHISLPAANIKVRWGQLVNFSGAGLDLQDGQVAEGNLHWTNGATLLGTGAKISVNNLPNGVNTITLTATNSKGLSAAATVEVTVDDNIEPDGPTMQVSPGSVTWDIASGETATQTIALDVANFGTGDLTWQVTSDSTWLTTSAASGVDGASVTVNGSPSGMVSGEVRQGTLTFTTSSNGSPQTIQVPVSLIMGDMYQSPYVPMASGYGIFLPMMKR